MHRFCAFRHSLSFGSERVAAYMMQLVWHASLDLVLHDLVLGLLEEGQELLVSAHDTVVGLVE